MKISEKFKKNIIYFVNDELKENFIVLDSCEYDKDIYSSFDFLIAFGEEKKENSSLENFYLFDNSNSKEWKFGYFSYDLKNEIKKDFNSRNTDYVNFSPIYFFISKNIFLIEGNNLIIEKTDIDDIKLFIKRVEEYHPKKYFSNKINIKKRTSKEEYYKNFDIIKNYIKMGDIYQINYCQEFYSEESYINPINVFFGLKNNSQSPFSALMRMGEKYIISSSPERFLKRIENKLISQPIKGTSKRSKFTFYDFFLRRRLKNSQKEISENTMIVDLVRNDLGVIAENGNVTVEEYCKLYSFKNIHQLISTIVCNIRNGINFRNILEALFPMGSMTGMPKHRAIEIIDEVEKVKRGVYSGSLGYIKPNGDFDFNVMIRSILYNKEDAYLSFMAGGGITNQSNKENEYEECFIKAESIIETIS